MKNCVRQQGFTLVEIMIAVAILGILVSIGLPAYNDYVTRSRLQAAFVALSNAGVLMEQSFQDNRRYDCNSVTLPTAEGFDIDCDSTGDNNYTLTATGTGSTTSGNTFTLVQEDDGNPPSRNTDATTLPGGAQNGCWVGSGC